jgi:hypothetical protein
MGTRAQFFIGNPQDIENRQWLGCIAFDGYPDGDCGTELANATSAEAFISGVEAIRSSRDDFTDPLVNSFPFPWRDDLFLTDYTYALFDGRTQVTCFHHGWRELSAVLADKSEDGPWSDNDELPSTVSAPADSGPKGPDSILIFSA